MQGHQVKCLILFCISISDFLLYRSNQFTFLCVKNGVQICTTLETEETGLAELANLTILYTNHDIYLLTVLYHVYQYFSGLQIGYFLEKKGRDYIIFEKDASPGIILIIIKI